MSYSEADTRANFIDPALKANGWEAKNIRREYCITAGRKFAGGQRSPPGYVDYLLLHDGKFIGIVEAKKEAKAPTDGLQQAIDYAQKLQVRFVYSTNGKAIYEFDTAVGKGDIVKAFPTPEELYARLSGSSSLLPMKSVGNTPLYDNGISRPRYYQELAVQKVMEALSAGKQRMLLTLATGTGKTFIAFQVVHKLLQSKWNLDGADRRPKVLFLADRNVLADQAINTFNYYEQDLVKVTGDEIRRRSGIVPANAYIFFAIYQAIADRGGADTEDEKVAIEGFYHSYPPDFFDLIIIDECHRGSANEGGSWRAILEYFSAAVHLGMTATPRQTDNADTYDYFGSPLYEYSLKEGINDGYLTPYKTKRIWTSMDEYVFQSGDEVVSGAREKDLYELAEFDRNVILPERTDMIARALLANMRTMDKTIVFCVDQTHALNMRDAINKHKGSSDSHYCVRVTSDEGKRGRALLELFQNNDKDIPVILTSSQMLTTGVDARNVRNIVLCRSIGSMVEFKQIVGRGTRLFEGKDFFTIIDFTGATNLFYDPEWDGPPAEREEVGSGPTIPPPPERNPPDDNVVADPDPPYERLVIKLADGRDLRITNIEVRYTGPDGRPMSAQEFLNELTGILPHLFKDEAELRQQWANPDMREALLLELGRRGFDGEHLGELAKIMQAEDSDYFDLLSYLAFQKEMLTRHLRAEAVAADSTFLNAFPQPKAQQFLLFLLKRYEKDGIQELGKGKLPHLIQLAGMGSVQEAGVPFGGIPKIREAYYRLQARLYQA